MLQAKSAYDSACTAFEKASLDKAKADRSYQLGMLSKIQYLQTEMAYLQAEGEKSSAYNTYYQAYDTYQWGYPGNHHEFGSVTGFFEVKRSTILSRTWIFKWFFI